VKDLSPLYELSGVSAAPLWKRTYGNELANFITASADGHESVKKARLFPGLLPVRFQVCFHENP